MSSPELENLARQLRGTPSYHILLRLLEGVRDDERSRFENTPATEAARGRVNMMKDLIALIRDNRR